MKWSIFASLKESCTTISVVHVLWKHCLPSELCTEESKCGLINVYAIWQKLVSTSKTPKTLFSFHLRRNLIGVKRACSVCGDFFFLFPLCRSVFWRISKTSNMRQPPLLLYDFDRIYLYVFSNGKLYSIYCPISQLFNSPCKANRTLQMRCLLRFLFSHWLQSCMSKVDRFSVSTSYVRIQECAWIFIQQPSESLLSASRCCFREVPGCGSFATLMPPPYRGP